MRRLIMFLILGVTIPVVAETPQVRLDALVQAYQYQPWVFADHRLGVGTAFRAAYRSLLWYVRMDESTRAQAGMVPIAEWVRQESIPGLDFTGHRTLTNGDIETLFRSDLWSKPTTNPTFHFKLLRLKGTQTDDRSMATIGKLYDLQILETSERVSDAGLLWLSNLSQLRGLSLPSFFITDKELQWVSRLKGLQSLDLSGTQVTDEGVRSLSHLSLLKLGVGARITDEGLASLREMVSLQELNLAKSRVSQRGLLPIAKLPRLHTLFLGASITNEDLPVLFQFSQLKRLDLSGAHISSGALSTLIKMKNLEELALSNTEVTDGVLEALTKLPNLRYLEISDTRITPEGLAHVSAFPSLKVISLTTTHPLKIADIAPFAQWPQLGTIVINGVSLGSASVSFLRQLRERRTSWWPSFIPELNAADLSEGLVQEQLHEASLAGGVSKGRFSGFHGLARIHEAQAAQDDVVSAVTDINKDTFQEDEKHFMGEFTVSSVSAPKIKH